jgi:hypothetical protein
MSEPKDRIEQALEVLLYAPIGAGLYIKDLAPTFVARGRAEFDRRQQQMTQRTTTAKSIGQVAVGFGVPMAKERVGREVGTARERAQSFLEVIGSVTSNPTHPEAVPNTPERNGTAAAAPRPTVVPPPAAEIPTPVESVPAPAGDSLPIPGYDALSASQVVERLAGLSTDELGDVRAYETAHRNRRTILGKIDQISA